MNRFSAMPHDLLANIEKNFCIINALKIWNQK